MRVKGLWGHLPECWIRSADMVKIHFEEREKRRRKEASERERWKNEEKKVKRRKEKKGWEEWWKVSETGSCRVWKERRNESDFSGKDESKGDASGKEEESFSEERRRWTVLIRKRDVVNCDRRTKRGKTAASDKNEFWQNLSFSLPLFFLSLWCSLQKWILSSLMPLHNESYFTILSFTVNLYPITEWRKRTNPEVGAGQLDLFSSCSPSSLDMKRLRKRDS